MTPKRWAAVDAVLQAALDVAPADRAAVVARECAGDRTGGERERALDWLERSVGREMYASYLAIDPTFRSLHGEPRFQALLKRLGLAA